MNEILIYALIALVCTVAYYHFVNRKYKTNDRLPGTEAPILYGYRNPYTAFMLFLCLTLITTGATLSVLGSLSGIVIGMLGFLIWAAGNTDHPFGPLTAGVLTFNSRPIIRNGKPILVGGRVILANYWPFYFSSKHINLSSEDREIKVTVYSKDRVAMPCVVSLTLTPDPDDLIDFIQSTNEEGIKSIFPQIDDIAKVSTQAVVRDYEAIPAVFFPEVISEKLITEITDSLKHPEKVKTTKKSAFESRSFGVLVKKFRFNPDLPVKLKEKLEAPAIELAERAAELEDYRTMIIAAKERQTAYAEGPSGKLVPLYKIVEEIQSERMIRQGQSARVETKGRGIAVTSVNPNPNA